jgi:hypothetical protein
MVDYFHRLRLGRGWKTGDSIVRDYNVHDEDHFSVEQKITFYFSQVHGSENQWLGKPSSFFPSIDH